MKGSIKTTRSCKYLKIPRANTNLCVLYQKSQEMISKILKTSDQAVFFFVRGNIVITCTNGNWKFDS